MTLNPIILKAGWTNCYLLKCAEGYLLLDTGFPNSYPIFLRELEKSGIALSQIKYLLLTHHHDDHAGFAARLIDQTRARVIVHQKAIAHLREGRFTFPGRMKPVNKLIETVFKAHSRLTGRSFRFPPLTITQDDFVCAGDDPELLKKIGIEGRILYTPGHTDDSISVLLPEGGVFVGDLAMNFLNFLGTRHRPVFFEDLKAVFENWKRVIELGGRTVYPAHGKPYPVEKLAQGLEMFARVQK
jgi:glyoxylase-like metal-dependent hydrolase (beta-lactamase superfamily II)